MKRKIITIDQELCNGCGICADACHEGAIAIQNGKAVLTRDDYCDGLGDCLPACPTGAITFEEREAVPYNESAVKKRLVELGRKPLTAAAQSRLANWPVQIKLVPTNAAYFQNANLLIAADCTAFSYGDFHQHFLKNHIALIGCPKLDNIDYSEKLSEILSENTIKSLTVVRMEVPCCRGLTFAVRTALEQSGKKIPWREVIVSTEGKLLL